MKTVTIKFGSVDNATSFVKAIEDFESHFDLIYGQYVVDAKSPLISQHNFFFKLYA